MDAFLTFLSNYYIYFLIAAGIFLFALIGLIIESSKKRKKEKEDIENEDVSTVESFRSGDAKANSSTDSVDLESTPEISSSDNSDSSIIDLGTTPSLEDNRNIFETPGVDSNSEIESGNIERIK